MSAEKARKATIYLGEIPIDVYMMPNGEYRLYAASITEAVNKPRNNLKRFLTSQQPEALPYKDLDLLRVPEIQVEGQGVAIKPIPIEIAQAYWGYEYRKGNQLAGALFRACARESIERRADAAFGIERTEEERQEQMAAQMSPDAIAAQEEYERQVELLQLQTQLATAEASFMRDQRIVMERSEAIVAIHGVQVLALIQGRPEAVVEVERVIERTVIGDRSGNKIVSFDGMSKTALAKKYGMKKAADFENWLESMGRSDLLVGGLTAVACQYVPREHLGEIERLWESGQGNRQRLLGE